MVDVVKQASLCKGDFDAGGKYCLGFGGATVDKRLAEEVVKVVSPLGIEASFVALEGLTESTDGRRQALIRQLEQLELEAARAFDQFDKVDPRNRLVADELKRRWNGKLAEVAAIKAMLCGLAAQTPSITNADHNTLMALGRDFEKAWEMSDVSLRKKIIRSIITEVIADEVKGTNELRFIIHWQGGCHTHFTMPQPMSAATQKSAIEDLELVRKMAPRYSDDKIALVLNKLGRTTGKGKRWNMSPPCSRLGLFRERAELGDMLYRKFWVGYSQG